MKKAIIIASFGAVDDKIRSRTIDALYSDVEENFSDFEIRQAYTSNFIRKKLNERGIKILSLEEQIKSLQNEGFEEILVLPTHLTAGEEFDNKIKIFADEKIKILPPMFSLKCNTNFDVKILQVVVDCFKTFGDEQLVLIGHGSPHRHNPVYENLQKLTDEKIHIGVIEPSDTPNFEDVLKRLQKNKATRVLIAPLLFNGGVHVTEDIAGYNKDSWSFRLIASGFFVRVCYDGLGSFEEFRRLYIERLESFLN